MRFYLAIKRNKILSFARKWMELENITFLQEGFLEFELKAPH
jgi:hypothetical protein